MKPPKITCNDKTLYKKFTKKIFIAKSIDYTLRLMHSIIHTELEIFDKDDPVEIIVLKNKRAVTKKRRELYGKKTGSCKAFATNRKPFQVYMSAKNTTARRLVHELCHVYVTSWVPELKNETKIQHILCWRIEEMF